MKAQSPHLPLFILGSVFSVFLTANSVHAQKNVFNSLEHQYSENFSVSMNSSQPRPWVDNETLVGWYARSSNSAAATYNVSTGNNSNGGLMAYGPTYGGTSTSTAFGSLTTYTVNPTILALELVNNTGATITSIDISFTQLQWYTDTNAAADVFFASYHVGNTTPDSSAFTLIPDLDLNGFVTGSTRGALPTPLAKSVTHVLDNIQWNSGESLWLRWIDYDVAGGDAGAGFSNMEISINSYIPEPATSTLVISAVMLAAMIINRRRR